MSEQSEVPSGAPEPSDPWAPPKRQVPLDKASSAPQPAVPPQLSSLSDRGQAPAAPGHEPTLASMPGAGPAGDVTPAPAAGAVPPPPVAPGGPAQPAPGPYGYPGFAPGGTVPGGAPGGSPYGTAGGWGYPGHEAGYPGYSGYPGYGQGGWPQAPMNGMGVAALVLGIISVVVFCLWGIGIILGGLAVIFGVIGRRRARRNEATNGGLALAGIILGSIGTVVGAATLAFIIWVVSHPDEFDTTTDNDPFAASLVIGTGH